MTDLIFLATAADMTLAFSNIGSALEYIRDSHGDLNPEGSALMFEGPTGLVPATNKAVKASSVSTTLADFCLDVRLFRVAGVAVGMPRSRSRPQVDSGLKRGTSTKPNLRSSACDTETPSSVLLNAGIWESQRPLHSVLPTK